MVEGNRNIEHDLYNCSIISINGLNISCWPFSCMKYIFCRLALLLWEKCYGSLENVEFKQRAFVILSKASVPRLYFSLDIIHFQY